MYDSFNDIKIDAYIKLISPLTIGSSEFNCLTIPTKLKYGKRKLEPNGTFHSWDWGIYIDNEFIIPTIDSINKCDFENSEEISDEMFLEKIDVFIDELKSAINTDTLKKSATDMLDEINKLR